jgi:hypothetical protein
MPVAISRTGRWRLDYKSRNIYLNNAWDTIMEFEYEVQVSALRDTIWIHSSDGSTVGRFGRMGIDLHNTVTEMMQGAPQCRLCTHGKPNRADWDLFRVKALEWWNVSIPADTYNLGLLAADKSPIETGKSISA